MLNKRILSVFIVVLIVFATLTLAQPTVKAAGPPYAWTGPTDINPAIGQDNLPAAVEATNGTSANTLWLAWQTFRFNNARPDIIFREYYNGTWGSIGRATSTFYNTTPALVQINNGTIFLLYAQERTNAFNIWYQRYSSVAGIVKCQFGSGSCPAIQLTNPTNFNDTAPTAAVGRDGSVWVFFQRSNQTCTSSCTQTKEIYYKTLNYNSTVGEYKWSADKQLTSDSNWNWLPSAAVSKDGLVRLAWTKFGQASGTSVTSSVTMFISYNGTSATWSAPAQVSTPPSGSGDQHPSLIQDRNGTLWVFWARTSLSSPQFILFNKFSTNVGASWSAESQMLTEASGIDDQQPAAVQGFANNTPTANDDRTIHLFYSSDRTNNDYDIWSLVSPAISPVHDVGISFTSYSNTSNGAVKYRGGVPYLGENSNVSFSMTVQNYGDTGENVRTSLVLTNVVTIALNAQTRPIGSGTSYNFVFNWNTTAGAAPGARLGWWTMNFTAVSLNSTETVGNRGDNTVISKNLVRLIPWGDLDQSGVVTITDASVYFFDYGYGPTGIPCTGTHCQFFPYEDLDNDGNISIIDVGIAVRNYGISV